jgi:hypothetical protein
MKYITLRAYSVLMSLFLAFSGKADTITWTNLAGGDWSVAANWSPNLVPGAADTAVLSSAATNGAALDMTVTLQNLVLNGGNLYTTGYSYDTLTITGEIAWTNGTLGCQVTNNGVVFLAGTDGVDYSLTQYLYNAGTFDIVSGNLLINYCGSDSGGFDNAPGGLIDIEHDGNIDISSNQFGFCDPLFVNNGIIRKSGGSGTASIYPTLNNSGTVDSQSGLISFNGGGTFDGTLQSEGTGGLVFATNIFNGALNLGGNLLSTNAFLEGASLLGKGTNNGVLTWISGNFASGNGVLTIGTSGALVLAGSNGVDYVLSDLLYNYGTIKLVSGNMEINYCGSAFGELINEPGGLIDFQSDVSIDAACGGELVNQGVVRKSGGAGTSDIGAPLNNNGGIIEAQTGIIGLTNSYYLASGNLIFDVASASAYGQIFLAGNPTLSGGLAVNLENGYVPTNGSAFLPVTYGSESGGFDPLSLPPWINWRTNYGSTALTLKVLNPDGQPILASPSVASGQITFQFTGDPQTVYSILATTNLAVPLTNWTVIGSANLLSNDLFQFVDTQTKSYPQRFYRLSSQ